MNKNTPTANSNVASLPSTTWNRELDRQLAERAQGYSWTTTAYHAKKK